MDLPIAPVVLAVSALLVTGCGDKIAACNEAKLTAGSSWRTTELLEQTKAMTGDPNNPRCAAAAHLAVAAAAKSPVEAKQASDAAALACTGADLAKSDADRAWTLCSKVER